MAKIILDKNLATEKTFVVDNVFERIIDNLLNGVKTVNIAKGEVIPTIPSLTDRSFTTVTVESGEGDTIPVVCQYNYIKNFSSQYFEDTGIYSYNIDLGKVEE